MKHACAIGDLPLHHRDPFDRMLAAQAKVESLTIITRDKHLKKYKISLINAWAFFNKIQYFQQYEERFFLVKRGNYRLSDNNLILKFGTRSEGGRCIVLRRRRWRSEIIYVAIYKILLVKITISGK